MGTFAGVFTPSILTILGLILFLRVGYVVGTTGLGETLLIILLANAISILTSISLAAIATNLKVKGGGVYYIISRTLGLPFGGAIGLVLFVAQAISVGFYCVGFAQGVSALFGLHNGLFAQAVAGLAVAATIALAWTGADWATRFQYVVMGLIGLALLAFATGAAQHWSAALLDANFGSANGWSSFWIAFAIFFPAVTGFTQGVNMSGDLANPGRSIPLGTAYAVGVSFVIYLVTAVLCAGSLPRSELTSNYSAMKTVAVFAPLIDIGIISATLSSALASMLGAPRILQSLAKDRVFVFLLPFAEGTGQDNNPRRGILLTGAIALGIVALGNLNLIAAIVSMFFVVTYGLLNYATFFEARGGSPSFRPSLRWYDPRISLAGWLAALGVMLAINLYAGLAAVVIVFGLFQYLKRSAIPARWADGQRSYNLQIVRENLIEANSRAEHSRDWRPQILAFSSNSIRRTRLLKFASWIEGNSGLTTVIRILEGKGRRILKAREQAEEELAEELKEQEIDAFPLVVSAPDLDIAVQVAVQSVGVGPTRVNTLLVNWPVMQQNPAEMPEAKRFARNLHIAYSLGCNLLIFDANEHEWAAVEQLKPERRVIDVWWRDNRTGRLMLVLAYLMTRSEEWRDATIRVILVASPEDAEAERLALEKELRDVRIFAEVRVISPVEDTVNQIAGTSAGASIVFMALAFRNEWFTDGDGNDLAPVLQRMPLTVLTMAADEVDLLTDPDEGEESERAAVKDAYEDAVRQRNAAVKAIHDASAQIEKLQEKLARLGEEQPESEEKTKAEIARLKEEIGRLKSEVPHLRSRLALNEKKLLQARADAEEMGINVNGRKA